MKSIKITLYGWIVIVLSNILLLIDTYIFMIYRYRRLEQITTFFGEELSFQRIVFHLYHELFVFTVGIASLFGLLFFKKNKWFFFLSALFISMQTVFNLIAFHLETLSFIRLIIDATFIYCLIFLNPYNIFPSQPIRRLRPLLFFAFLYLIYFLIFLM